MPPTPDWQLPEGVDRGLWDYFHAADMVANYDDQMAASPLAARDVAYCREWFPKPGKLIDLGCGTGRLCKEFGSQGYVCLGVDLSEEMLAKARHNNAELPVRFQKANLLSLEGIPDGEFDYAACLFSTLGMIKNVEERVKATMSFARVVKPGGTLVLHAHNRWFRELGLKRFYSGNVTMRQAYGGAALTLHHFTNRELTKLLTQNGWTIRNVIRVDINGNPARKWGRGYGFLLAAVRN